MKRKPRLVILNPTCLEVLEAHRTHLDATGLDWKAEAGFCSLQERDVDSVLTGADGLILPASIRDLPRGEQMRRHSSLKVLSIAASGYDWLDVEAATQNGIVVTNAPVKEGVEVVADMTWALVLAVARQIPHYHQRICGGCYERGMGVVVWGKTLGIVGLGQIGRAVARRAAGFEMRVLATEPQPDLAFVAKHGIKIVSLETLLRESDFVTLHVRLDAGTRGMIGDPQLRLMKPTATLINTARQQLVDEAALAGAVLNGRLAGAGLDDPPLSPDTPLRGLPNVVFAPHHGNRAIEGVHAVFRCAIDNAVAVLAGATPNGSLMPRFIRNRSAPRRSTGICPMKIRDIEVHPIQAPPTLVVVLVQTDEGLTGVGEAGLQRRWKGIQGVAEHLRNWLIGQDPMRIEYLWQRMWRGGFYPADRLIGSLVSGIDIALWDIKGQALGVPVYELLGGRCRDHLDCFFQPGYLTSKAEHPQQQARSADRGHADLGEVREIAQRYVADGWKHFRVSPNAVNEVFDATAAMRQTLHQLQAVREAVGDKLELMVDLHARLSPAEAVWFCRECEPLRVFVVEDPIRSEHPAGYRHIRTHSNVPLAAGEQWAGKWEFRTVIEEELVDYVRPDLCIAGGISEGRNIAAMAEAHFIKLLLHNPLGLVCTAACLHLALACDNAGPQEVLRPPQDMLPDVFECSFRLEHGHLSMPTTPGIGVKFNKETAKMHPPDLTEPPHWRRGDVPSPTIEKKSGIEQVSISVSREERAAQK